MRAFIVTCAIGASLLLAFSKLPILRTTARDSPEWLRAMSAVLNGLGMAILLGASRVGLASPWERLAEGAAIALVLMAVILEYFARQRERFFTS